MWSTSYARLKSSRFSWRSDDDTSTSKTTFMHVFSSPPLHTGSELAFCWFVTAAEHHCHCSVFHGEKTSARLRLRQTRHTHMCVGATTDGT